MFFSVDLSMVLITSGPGLISQKEMTIRVPTRQGKVREICFFFKVREKSGNSVK